MSDPGFGFMEYVKLAIFWASWLWVPATAFICWRMVRGSVRSRIAGAFALVLIGVGVYARFIEPRILLSPHHEIALERCAPNAAHLRVAAVSDLHIGLFGNAMPVARIANRLAALHPDLVLIAGDLTYYLDPDKFEQTYAPLRDVGAPVYVVMGNHDNGMPGPDVSKRLTVALRALGLDVIDGARERLKVRGLDVSLIGVWDVELGRRDYSMLEEKPSSDVRIVLTHDPHAVWEMPKGAWFDLLVAGHTHGGQIDIPGLTCLVTKVCGEYRYGLYKKGRGPVFVTSGTGMVGLPARFRVPPRIDVLDLTMPACPRDALVSE